MDKVIFGCKKNYVSKTHISEDVNLAFKRNIFQTSAHRNMEKYCIRDRKRSKDVYILE